MSEREQAISLINSLPESQMEYVLNMLKSFSAAIYEAADMAFCESLYEDYLNDNDPDKDDAVSLKEMAEQLGISL